MLPKLSAKLMAIFRLLPDLFLCPKINWLQITYTMLSNIFIFAKILKLQFLPKTLEKVANFLKDYILGATFS